MGGWWAGAAAAAARLEVDGGRARPHCSECRIMVIMGGAVNAESDWWHVVVLQHFGGGQGCGSHVGLVD